MTSEKVSYRYKGSVSNIFIPMIIILTILSMVFKLKSEYMFIVKIICFAIAVMIFIISIIKVGNKDLGILKHIGIGSIFIALVRFIDIEFNTGINDILIILFYTQLINLRELMNIMLSMFFFEKGKSPLWQSIFFISTTPFIYFGIKGGNKGLVLISNKYSDYFILFISEVIIILLYLIIIALYNKYNYKRDKIWILINGLLIVLSSIFVYLSRVLNIDLTYLIGLSKIIMYFLIYDKFEKILLYNAFSNAYESLNKAKETKRNLNKSLKRREKELLELNLLIEKSEKRYYDVVQAFSKGLLLFENNFLIYSNYDDECYYERDPSRDPRNELMELSTIISRITGEYHSNDEEIEDFTTEIDITNENGEKRNLEIYLVKIYGNKKLLVFNDITDIIKKRKEIVNIEKKIKDENIKEEFYSNISHELRTPINVIYSALQLNDIYLKNNQITKINKNNEIIKQNCLRLIRTISNFIDSNKLNEGFLEVDKKIYNVVEIIENIVLACDYYMKLRNINLIFDPEREEIKFLCDKGQIERIMLNILSNSLKYGKDNGHIYVTVNIKDSSSIVIKVVNDAEAIPEDKRKDIFEKFTKVNSSLSRTSEGSGLGLFLTKGLVENHNGEISISTGVKFGNTFKIVFPYDKSIEGEDTISTVGLKINPLEEKVDIEFSDIYF
ncbi:MAG: HAMP domain-containing histidine kinase [Clostridium sp.]|nr:HAMP domain-containing histidine kinase [Clostridium sp.]